MTVRLRPHHLLCLLTYAGKGYSPAFIANYDHIARRLSDGEDIVITEGPDGICAPLLDGDGPHCWRESVSDRDRRAADDVGQFLSISIAEGTRLKLPPALLRQMRAAIADGRVRAACSACEWFDLCSAIAADDYDTTRVHSPGFFAPR